MQSMSGGGGGGVTVNVHVLSVYAAYDARVEL